MKVGKHVFIAATVQFDIQFPELISIDDGAIIGMHAHLATHEVTHTHIDGRVTLPAAWSDPAGCIVRIRRQSNKTRFAVALRVLAAV